MSNSSKPLNGESTRFEKPLNQSKDSDLWSYVLAAMIATVVVFSLLAAQRLNENPSQDAVPSTNELKNPAAVKVKTVTEFNVSADPGASYRVFDVVKREDNLIEVFSRRSGSSGISYSRRLVNCRDWTFMYLSEGDTVRELSILRPDKGMSKLIQGSSSTAVSYQGCKLAGLAN